MCDEVINLHAKNENARTLSKMLGITRGEAGQLLSHTITLAAKKDSLKARKLAIEIKLLLERTISDVKLIYSDIKSDIEICSDKLPSLNNTDIYIYIAEDHLSVSDSPLDISVDSTPHALLNLLSACYCTGIILKQTLSLEISAPIAFPFNINFEDLIDINILNEPLYLGEAYLAGAGAVGNGFLWALRHLNVEGKLYTCDDDEVDDGNINRQIFFTNSDIGHPKAKVLSAKAQPYFKNLVLTPRISRLETLDEKKQGGAWLKRLIVSVDSRRARRRLQEECPGEVFDASTTDISEIVLHYNKQPNDKACLGCIYIENEKEKSLEAHIAEVFDVSISEVQGNRISESAAKHIAIQYKEHNLSPTAIEDMAYDSLFKSMCGEGKLKKINSDPLITPFCFVSVLAGALLVIELVKRSNSKIIYNYWKVSPWHPPLVRLRRLRNRHLSCAQCTNKVLNKLNLTLWK